MVTKIGYLNRFWSKCLKENWATQPPQHRKVPNIKCSLGKNTTSYRYVFIATLSKESGTNINPKYLSFPFHWISLEIIVQNKMHFSRTALSTPFSVILRPSLSAYVMSYINIHLKYLWRFQDESNYRMDTKFLILVSKAGFPKNLAKLQRNNYKSAEIPRYATDKFKFWHFYEVKSMA